MTRKSSFLPLTVSLGIALGPFGAAQDKIRSATGPAQIAPEILILPEQVVEAQWPATLSVVHPPKEVTQVEPGQCVRFGVAAFGNGRDQLLKQAFFSFEFSVSGKTQIFAPAPPQAVKLTTPFMGQFLIDTLFKNRAPKEVPQDGALAASAQGARWCAPVDVQDATATVQGTATLADGKAVALKRRNIEIKTFATARKKNQFKQVSEADDWLMHYHEAPDPALLLPALRLIANNQEARDMLSTPAFFVAALKASPAAAEELMQRLPTEDHLTQRIGIAVLGLAGYPTEPLRDSLDASNKTVRSSGNLPDAFDMTPNSEIGARQDMLWAIFFATGQIEPVRAIASELAWSEDYAKLMEHRSLPRTSAARATEYPEYAGRGAAYSAAGWSMGSISMQDSLLSDYIEAMKASPDTPPSVKKELANLLTNPAFKVDPGAKERH